MYITVTVHRKE